MCSNTEFCQFYETILKPKLFASYFNTLRAAEMRPDSALYKFTIDIDIDVKHSF